MQLVIAREYGFDSWRQILLEVSRLRDGGEPVEPEGSGLAQTWAPDGSPVQFECAVQSNHNVATFIKELVLTLPDGVVLSEIPDSVRVLIPPHQMQYAEIEVDDEYRAEWLKYDLFAHRPTSTQPQSGTFHLANSPAENAMLKCTVRIASPPPGSNHPPGVASSYVFSLKPGDKVLVTGLLGRSPVKESNAEMVFLGGGAAMGPIRAYISDQLIRAKTTQKISYWYGARNLQELYYADDLDALEKAHDNFSWQVVCTDPGQKRRNGHQGFVHDLLSSQFLKQHPAPGKCDYYIGGPPPLVDAAIAMLQEFGVGFGRIYTIDFRAPEKAA